MFNEEKIVDLTYDYVGIRGISSNSPLATPQKGIFTEDVCPLLTYDNIKKVLPKDTQDVNALLVSKFKYYTREVLSKLTTHKKVNKVTRDVLDRTTAFTGLGSLNQTIINKSKFVGWQIELKKGKDTVVDIKEIGLQATDPQPSLPIYVFHTSQREPIATRTITTHKGGSFQWYALDEPIVLSYYANEGDDYETGGYFYIGYFQDDLVGSAIRKDVNFVKPPCSTCDGGRNYRAWSKWSKYIAIGTAETDDMDKNDPQMVDTSELGLSDGLTYGLNFSFSVRCDLTKFFLDHLHLLVEPIKYSVASGLLKEMIYSSRDNVEREKSLDLAYLALYGDDRSDKSSISYLAKQSLEALDFDTSQLSSVCMQGHNSGVKFGTI